MIKILYHELLLAYRHRFELMQPWLFFIIVVVLFPLAMNPDSQLLQTIAPGIIWIAALLATLLFLDNLFLRDFADGTLEKIILSSHSLAKIILIKIFAHWLTASFPLIVLTPLLALILHLTGYATFILLLSLLLGTPILSFVGAIGVALTLGLRQGGILLALLILPLYIPVLIFGTSAVNHALLNNSALAELLILAALLVLSFTLAPFAIASALKLSVNY